MVSCFFCPRTLKGDDKVANPHFEIKITKRSKRQSAVAGAAYQSGENLFSEYDQKHKDYRKKEGVVYTEVMLPSHPPGHNPHCHIMLTMRAIDENGKWLPKSRKVYDLDENGERIKLPSGRWKSHKEDTVDWNEQYHAEEWRHGWEVIQNKYLELAGSPERVDMRSYARQGIDVIPTVHMGAAVSAMERKGIKTNIGNLNRDIKSANSLMAAIRKTIKSLLEWIADVSEATKEALAEMKEQNASPTLAGMSILMSEKRNAGTGLATDRTKAVLLMCRQFPKLSHI